MLTGGEVMVTGGDEVMVTGECDDVRVTRW